MIARDHYIISRLCFGDVLTTEMGNREFRGKPGSTHSTLWCTSTIAIVPIPKEPQLVGLLRTIKKPVENYQKPRNDWRAEIDSNCRYASFSKPRKCGHYFHSFSRFSKSENLSFNISLKYRTTSCPGIGTLQFSLGTHLIWRPSQTMWGNERHHDLIVADLAGWFATDPDCGLGTC